MKKDKTRKKSSAYKKYRRHKILFITELDHFDSAAGIWLFCMYSSKRDWEILIL